MAELMQRSAIPVDRLMIGGLWRYLHEVMRRAVEGCIAADVERSPAGGDDRICFSDGKHRVGRNRRRGHVLGQTFALVDIEHREPLEESNGFGFAVFAACLLGFCLGRKPVGIADGRALLALAYIAASGLCLAVGQPALGAVAPHDHFSPEDQDVDARVPPVC